MSVCVIVVAAGRGERLGGATPKQLLEIGGRSILRRSIDVFDAHPAVTAIVVVLSADRVEAGPTLVGPTRSPLVIVPGGSRRQDSVAAGLGAVPAEASIVLVHDAARPFANRAVVDRVIAAAERTGATVPAVPASDTIKRVPIGSHLVRETIARGEIWLTQTPQGFRRDVLARAVDAGRTATDATDEAMLVEDLGLPVEVVPGDERNVKITTPEDLETARRRLEGPLGVRIGTGYDSHRLVPGRPLVLAGVVLPFDKGPLGHSDGDVVCHALTDALFGAAGAGDIGQHFPNTDRRWKDAPGLDLLGRAVSVLADGGWRASNVDVTVILERPKIAPHLPAIRQAIAGVLGIEASRVSVKGKTNEGADAVGAGEAIVAHAVALIARGGGA